MGDPFMDTFGNMLTFRNQHAEQEYLHTVKEIEDIIHSRNGNPRTSKVLQYTDALRKYHSNMKLHGATKEQLNAFYKDALNELYPLAAKVRIGISLT